MAQLLVVTVDILVTAFGTVRLTAVATAAAGTGVLAAWGLAELASGLLWSHRAPPPPRYMPHPIRTPGGSRARTDP